MTSITIKNKKTGKTVSGQTKSKSGATVAVNVDSNSRATNIKKYKQAEKLAKKK